MTVSKMSVSMLTLGLGVLFTSLNSHATISCRNLMVKNPKIIGAELILPKSGNANEARVKMILVNGKSWTLDLSDGDYSFDRGTELSLLDVSIKPAGIDGETVQILLFGVNRGIQSGYAYVNQTVLSMGFSFEPNVKTQRLLYENVVYGTNLETSSDYAIKKVTDIHDENLAIIELADDYRGKAFVLKTTGRREKMLTHSTGSLEVSTEHGIAIATNHSPIDGPSIWTVSLGGYRTDVKPVAFPKDTIAGTETTFELRNARQLKVLSYDSKNLTLQIDIPAEVEGQPVTERRIYNYNMEKHTAKLFSSRRL